MAKALVTGAAGFIGSHVVKHLQDGGVDVFAFDDLSGGFRDNLPERVPFIEGSVTDYELLQTLFEDLRFEYVFHLAAYAAEGLSHFIRIYNYNTNLLGSVNLINLSVLFDVKCFVFTSSIAVYGKNQLPMTEDLVPRPEDPYGISKYATELDLAAAREQFGLDYIVFRPHNVYGEHQNIGDKYRNVVGIFMNQIMSGKPLTVFGDGKQTRAFSYIDDVAPVIAKSIRYTEAYGETFNIGGDQPYTVNELARMVGESMGESGEIVYLPARNEVKHAIASQDKARAYFDLAEPTPLREGLSRMATWAKAVGSRQTQDFTNIEIPFALPSGW